MGWLDPGWVSGQFSQGDAAPFLIWTAFIAALFGLIGYRAGRTAGSEEKPGSWGEREHLRGWLRQSDARAMRALWQSWRDDDWGDTPTIIQVRMNVAMNSYPRMFHSEYRRIVGEEPQGWKTRR